jgi:SAM-dependent methyltransferase
MVSRARWLAAQVYEREYWRRQAEEIASGAMPQYDWYQWRADQLVARLNRLQLSDATSGRARVIEVGCGPVGLAGFFPASERLLVDPLEDYYRHNEVLSKLRNPEAVYRAGGGEALPAEAGQYDLAVIENCIDHVRDADAVMRELVRVLRVGGLLYLTVNCRTPTGYWVHRMLSRLRLDPGHPHTFTPPKLRRMLEHFGFDVLDIEVGSYAEALKEDQNSASRKARLKARLGISEFLASALARKRATT